MNYQSFFELDIQRRRNKYVRHVNYCIYLQKLNLQWKILVFEKSFHINKKINVLNI